MRNPVFHGLLQLIEAYTLKDYFSLLALVRLCLLRQRTLRLCSFATTLQAHPSFSPRRASRQSVQPRSTTVEIGHAKMLLEQS